MRTAPGHRKPNKRVGTKWKKGNYGYGRERTAWQIESPPYSWEVSQDSTKIVFIVENNRTGIVRCLNRVLLAAEVNFAAATAIPIAVKDWYLCEEYVQLHFQSVVAGKKIIILPDNDKSGVGYARRTAVAIWKLNPTYLKIVMLPDLPKGGNFVDWYYAEKEKNDGDTSTVVENLRPLCAETKPVTPEDIEEWTLIEDVSDGISGGGWRF